MIFNNILVFGFALKYGISCIQHEMGRHTDFEKIPEQILVAFLLPSRASSPLKINQNKDCS
jgi:hypothetical protein